METSFKTQLEYAIEDLITKETIEEFETSKEAIEYFNQLPYIEQSTSIIINTVTNIPINFDENDSFYN